MSRGFRNELEMGCVKHSIVVVVYFDLRINVLKTSRFFTPLRVRQWWEI